mgnify:CR=1 FL=1
MPGLFTLRWDELARMLDGCLRGERQAWLMLATIIVVIGGISALVIWLVPLYHLHYLRMGG